MMLLFGTPVYGQVTEAQLARLDPKAESMSVLLQTVKDLLKNEQLEEALPFLEEVLVRLEGEAGKKAGQTLAFSLFQLAQCHMKLGHYEDGAHYFVRFAEEYPQDHQVASARIQAAQCQTILQKWPEVEAQAAIVLQDKGLGEDLRVAALQLLVEARFRQERWADTVAPLRSMFRVAKNDTVRSGAAVMLLTCYVRLNDYNALFGFLPHCDEVARHDIGLNMALLEAGDARFNAGEYQKALLLYRQVLLRRELLVYHENRMRAIKLTMTPYVADGKQSISDYREEMDEKQARFDLAKKHYETVDAFQDYDRDVTLRMAQCFNELGRNWPAHTIYRHFCEEYEGDVLADQARYSAFGVLLDEQEWKQASAEGYEYIEKLPKGEYIDEMTLNLMQLHMQQGQFDAAFEMGSKALRLSPEHRHIDQVRYLMGYCRFVQQSYDDALIVFEEVLQRWPESIYYESAEYWRCMSMLFLGRYPESVTAFKGYLTNPKYPEKRFKEDASYRLGIAHYGAEEFPESESVFTAFVDDFPASTLVSEAYAMLGDLRAAEGDMDAALAHYHSARNKAQNIAQVSYPLFQTAKVLELQKDHAAIIVLMSEYLREYAEAGDYAQAVYWKSKCFKALDEYPRALDAGLEVVDEFGGDAQAAGTDAILKALVEDYHSEEWMGYQSVIADRISKRLAAAGKRHSRPLELRYQAALASMVDGAQRQEYIDAVVKEENVSAAGSAVLVLMAREGVKRGDFELVHAAARRFRSTFAISNDMLYIMNADLDALIAEERYADALVLSDEILEKFGYSPSVGWARKRRGDAFRLRGDFERALEAYKEVLSIREWRGVLTPEALYCSGLCKLELGQVDEAFAYFQRIYVLYEEYIEWSSKAYARSVECLERLGGREQEMINTCREMLANERLADTPEGAAARKRLRAMGAGEVVP